MKKIALIGASGQLGTDIKKVFDKEGFFEVVPLTHTDIDITSYITTGEILKKIAPNMVINLAAYHRVDEIEDNPTLAFEVNAFAERNLAQLSAVNGWTLVYLSTDYVFGQEKGRQYPYTEDDKTGPVNVYGASKVAGETFTRYLCPNHFIIRTSGLFGVAGSSGKGGNFIETMIRLGKENKKVSVVIDQALSPTYTLNVAENLHELLKKDGEYDSFYGTYHMASRGYCSWWEFAKEIFKFLKMDDVVCERVESGFFGAKARRPDFSSLDNLKLELSDLDKMRHWKENLELYLKEKGYL